MRTSIDSRRIDLIRLASEMDLLTTPYAFNPDEAAAMAEAGADILIPHMGLTTKGSIGAQTALTLANPNLLLDLWCLTNDMPMCESRVKSITGYLRV